MEQHYPSRDPPKKKYTQEYEYEKPTLKDRNSNRNPTRQPPKPSYKQPSYEDDYDYRMPKGRGDNFDNKAIKEVNR